MASKSRKTRLVELEISKIRQDGGTQPRSMTTIPELVAEYAQDMKDGDVFPPVQVCYDGTYYWLWDGYNRVAAAKNAGSTTITCLVYPGSQRDARLKAAGANAKVGLRRTVSDKRRAVQILLDDKEWGGRSIIWIASATKLSQAFVKKVIDERERSENPDQVGRQRHGLGRDGKLYGSTISDGSPLGSSPDNKANGSVLVANPNGSATSVITQPNPDIWGFSEYLKTSEANVQVYLKTDIGIVDILTDDAVYHVVHHLSPSNIEAAVGNVVLRRRMLIPRGKAVIVAFSMAPMPKQIEMASQEKIEIRLWKGVPK